VSGAFILVALQIVAAVPQGSASYAPPRYGWQPIGEFASAQACVEASKRLIVAGQPQERLSDVRASAARFECLATGAEMPRR
jgi:hypothetical protein